MNCMCYTIPILKTEEEFWAEDSENSTESVNEVTDMPEGFKNWIKDNQERIEKAEARGALPYFIKDNRETVEEILKPKVEPKKTALEIAAERHAARTPEDMARIQIAWNQNRMEHLMELSKRIGFYRDPDLRNIFILLEGDHYAPDFDAFKIDYKLAKQYIEDKIKAETELVRRMMQDPAMRANLQEVAKALGVDIAEPMTFFEANVMRGNPNYSVSEAYRINCQTCVVANELRRRGLNLEALANTKGSWLEKLSQKTNEIWVDADGNIPAKKRIGAEYYSYACLGPDGRRYKRGWNKTVSNRKQLIAELESSISEDGRYHIDWCWNTQSKYSISGHIITVEKIDGVLRYYDPQNGKVIANFYDYINNIKLDRGINLLRVDNLRVNPEYASHILGKSGSDVISGVVGQSVTKGALNLSGDIKSDIATYVRQRNALTTNRERVALDLQIIQEGGFIRSGHYSTPQGSIFATEELPKKINKDNLELSKNIQMAQKMAKNGYDCYLLSNPHGIKSADFIFAKDGKVFYAEGKLSTGKSSLDHNLAKGGRQSERILIDLTGTKDTNYISSQLEKAFEENENLKEVMILKRGRLMPIDFRMVQRSDFKRYFKKLWEQKK